MKSRLYPKAKLKIYFYSKSIKIVTLCMVKESLDKATKPKLFFVLVLRVTK